MERWTFLHRSLSSVTYCHAIPLSFLPQLLPLWQDTNLWIVLFLYPSIQMSGLSLRCPILRCLTKYSSTGSWPKRSVKLHFILQKAFCCLNNRMDCSFGALIFALICCRDHWQPCFSPLVVFVISNGQLKNTYSLRSSARTATKDRAVLWHCLLKNSLVKLENSWLYHYWLKDYDHSWIGVHGQTHVTKSKWEEKHTSLKFAAFHNQSPLLTMVSRMVVRLEMTSPFYKL